jgi:hypothetical protein
MMAFACFCLVSLLLQPEATLQLKVVQAAPPMEVAADFRTLLQGEALQVSNDKGELLCEVWFRKVVPMKATAEQVQNGLTYREIEQTTLIGVIRFPQTFKDYRRQDVPPGVYTLRFILQPQNGDHAGSAPYQEFCLLCDIKKDTKPGTMEVKELIEQSAASLGGSHPSMMLLFPQPQLDIKPKLADEGKGHWSLRSVLRIEADGKPGKLGIGLTVAGHSPIS